MEVRVGAWRTGFEALAAWGMGGHEDRIGQGVCSAGGASERRGRLSNRRPCTAGLPVYVLRSSTAGAAAEACAAAQETRESGGRVLQAQ